MGLSTTPVHLLIQKSKGVKEGRMRSTLKRCEIGDGFVKSTDVASCKSASGFESALEAVESVTMLPLIPNENPDVSDVSEAEFLFLSKLKHAWWGRTNLMGRKLTGLQEMD
jgi:hypothetical protein